MDYLTRRQFIGTVVTGTAVGLSGCEQPSSVESSPSSDGESPRDGRQLETVGLEPLVQGLQAPVSMTFAPDADRRYILEQSGLVICHEVDGLADEPALDLRDAVTAGGRKDILGIALHPGFADNRRLFLRYSAPRRRGTPREFSHTFVLSEFRATPDGRRIRGDSERTVLEIPEPQSNHNAGDIAFGPDDFLYVPVGDGGAGGDQGPGHVEDWYDDVGGGNGQDVTENLLSSLLRIDVDGTANGRPYGIPDDNPLVGRDGLDELYAWGLRNPWRMSFDGSALFVADVGQNRFEEVNLVERGGNYGWNVKEGTHCFQADDCPDRTPDEVRGGEPLLDPIIEYPNSRLRDAPVSGISVIGGEIYRGSALPELEGRFVFGDLNVEGRLFTAERSNDGGLWTTRTLAIADEDADSLQQLFSVAHDSTGEVYVLGVGNQGGGVHRLAPAN